MEEMYEVCLKQLAIIQDSCKEDIVEILVDHVLLGYESQKGCEILSLVATRICNSGFPMKEVAANLRAVVLSAMRLLTERSLHEETRSSVG